MKDKVIVRYRTCHPILELQAWLGLALVAAGVTIGVIAAIMPPLLSHAHDARVVRMVDVTAYSPRVQETDSTPFINAEGLAVAEGQIAVSRDLFRAGWVFGRRVWIQGHGIYRISDLMNKRFRDRLDIFFFNTKDAKRFGQKKLVVALLGEE